MPLNFFQEGGFFRLGSRAGTEIIKEITKSTTRQNIIIVSQLGKGDYEDIQSAVDDLPATGGRIYVDDGVYELATSLIIDKNNVFIEFSEFSTIKRKTDFVGDVIKIGNGSTTRSDITLKGLKIDDLTGSSGSDGIELDKTTRVKFIDCSILNTHDAPFKIDADSSFCWMIRCRTENEFSIFGDNCWMSNCVHTGDLAVSGDDNRITGNSLTASSFGVSDAGSNRLIFTGNTLEEGGLEDDIYFTGTRGIIVGNVNKSSTYNFDVSLATSIIFEHNQDL